MIEPASKRAFNGFGRLRFQIIDRNSSEFYVLNSTIYIKWPATKDRQTCKMDRLNVEKKVAEISD